MTNTESYFRPANLPEPDLPDVFEHLTVVIYGNEVREPESAQATRLLRGDTIPDLHRVRDRLITDFKEERVASVCALLACGMTLEASRTVLDMPEAPEPYGEIRVSWTRKVRTEASGPAITSTTYERDTSDDYTEVIPGNVAASARIFDQRLQELSGELEYDQSDIPLSPRRLLHQIMAGSQRAVTRYEKLKVTSLVDKPTERTVQQVQARYR